jgi:hypothetical protein
MSSVQQWPLSQEMNKKSGVCSVCFATRQLHIRDGTVHLHGPRNDPSLGSNRSPVDPLATDSTSAVGPKITSSPSSPSSSPAQINHLRSSNEDVSHPKLFGPTIKWIPKAARSLCASLFNGLLRAIILKPDSLSAWKNLLRFAPTILAKPARGGSKKNLTNVISHRVAQFHAANYQTQPREARKHEKLKTNFDSEQLARSVSAKLEEGNFKGAVRLICSDEVPARASAETFAALQLKHPSPPSNRTVSSQPQNQTETFKTTADKVRKALFSFPAGSSGGPDGLTPQHIRDMVSIEGASSPLLSAITDFINGLFSGFVPVQVRSCFFGGRLIALSKKDGGLRPIAVGYTLRRLAAKIANFYATTIMSASLSPLQLGVGTAGGMEAAVHATRQYLHQLTDESAIVKLDFKNAFNSLRRDSMLEALHKNIPELYTFVHSAYASSSLLQYENFVIQSNEGVQQGDPLGPLLFSMTVHPLLLQCSTELKVGYLDDFTFGGCISSIVSNVVRLQKDAIEIGLELNTTKCEFIRSKLNSIVPCELEDFAVVHPNDATLLGSPLSAGNALELTLKNRLHDLKRAAQRLSLLYSHDALVILRHSVSLPSLLHNLRSAPCSGHPVLEEFDNELRNCLSQILNQKIDDLRWSQASLPVHAGGLGIRSVCQLAPSAFLASAAGTAALVRDILPSSFSSTTETLQILSLQNWTALSLSQPPTGLLSHAQRAWDGPVIDAVKANLLSSLTSELDQARLRAAFSPHSGDWLNAPPLTCVGLRLDDETLRIAVGLRLGSQLCLPHVCPCGATVKENGIHGLSCRRGPGRHLRHSLINDIIWRTLQRAQIPSIKEPTGLTADGKRPDGATLIPWAKGKCLAWDATVPDTLAASHLHATCTTPGAAANSAAALKIIKYASIVPANLFVPVSVETLGPWDSDGLNFVKELGRRVSAHTLDPRETTYVLQQISVAIQRGNAAAFLGCLPTVVVQP